MNPLKISSSILVVLLFSIIFCCSPARESFTTKGVNAKFFSRILKGDREKFRVLDGVDSVIVYKTRFQEIMVEKNSLLDWTWQTSSSQHESVPYWEGSGQWVDLYMFQLNSPNKRSHFIYTNVKYNKVKNEAGSTDTVCFGFGPVYFGVKSIKPNVIEFNRKLKVKKQGASSATRQYVLSKKKCCNRLGLAFVLDKTPPDSILNLDRIVNLKPNKIGGKKWLVFDLDSIYREKSPILFVHDKKSIKL